MIIVYSLEQLGFSKIKKGSIQNFIFVYTSQYKCLDFQADFSRFLLDEITIQMGLVN